MKHNVRLYIKLIMCLWGTCCGLGAAAQTLSVTATAEKGATKDGVLHVLENTQVNYSLSFNPDKDVPTAVTSLKYTFTGGAGDIPYQFTAPQITIPDFSLSAGANASSTKSFVATLHYKIEKTVVVDDEEVKQEETKTVTSNTQQVRVWKAPSANVQGGDAVYYYQTPNNLSWTVQTDGGYTSGWTIEWTYDGNTTTGNRFTLPRYENTSDEAKTLEVTVKITNKSADGQTVWYEETKQIRVWVYPQATVELKGSPMESNVYEKAEAKDFQWNVECKNGNPDGWEYEWVYNGVKSTGTSFVLPEDYVNPGTELNTLSISLKVINKSIDGVTKWVDETYSIKVHVHPKASVSFEGGTSLDLYEKTNSQKWTAVPTGGNKDGWTYEWKFNNGSKGTNATYTLPYTSNSTKEIKSLELVGVAINKSPDGSQEWYRSEEFKATVNIYPTATATINGSASTSVLKYVYKSTDDMEAFLYEYAGGNPDGWKFEWVDEEGTKAGTEYKFPSYTNEGSSFVAKTVTATATNMSPDGKQEWKRVRITITARVFPEAKGTLSRSTEQTLFRGSVNVENPNELSLSFQTSGGYSLGWSYEWGCNGVKSTSTSKTYRVPAYDNNGKTVYEMVLTAKAVNKGPDGNVWFEYPEEQITIQVFPKVFAEVADGTERELYYTTTGMQSIRMNTEGGNVNGWSYKWEYAGNVSTTSTYTLPNYENTTNTAQDLNVKVTVTNTDTDGKTVLLNETHDIVVTVYPKASAKIGEMPTHDFCGSVTGQTSVAEIAGGNSSGWTYEWSFNGNKVEGANSTYELPTYVNNDLSEIQHPVLKLKCTNRAKNGTVLWQSDDMDVTFNVYPKTQVEVAGGNAKNFYITTNGEVNLQVDALGGNASGWSYEWESEGLTGTTSSLTLPERVNDGVQGALIREAQVRVINKAPNGTDIWYDKTETVFVSVYPEASEALMGDKQLEFVYNVGDLDWSSMVFGGNPDGWVYTWTRNGSVISETSGCVIPAHANTTTERESNTIKLKVKNHAPGKPNEVWFEKEEEIKLYVYARPTIEMVNPVIEAYTEDPATANLQIKGTDAQSSWQFDWTLNDGRQTVKGSQSSLGFNMPRNTGDNVREYTMTVRAVNTIPSAFNPANTVVIVNGEERTFRVRSYSKGRLAENKIVLNSTEIYGGVKAKDVSMSIVTAGGNPEGWTYVWSDNGSVCQETTPTISRTYSNTGTREEVHRFTANAKNTLHGVQGSAYELSTTVTIWPECRWAEDMTIADAYNAKTANDMFCVREGNEYSLQINGLTGGYKDQNWKYQWSIDGSQSSASEPSNVARMSNVGETKSITTVPVTVRVEHIGPEGNVWDYKNYTKEVKVYRRPKTPASLVKKGSGASCTMVATMSTLTDNQLDSYEYNLVFGYEDASGQMHDNKPVAQSTGTTRFDTFPSSVYSNSSNRFYVYAVWYYPDGFIVTSGKRYTNKVDESWDGSDYDPSTRSEETAIELVESDMIDGGAVIYDLNGHRMTNVSSLRPGIYIKEIVKDGVRTSTKFMVK